MRYPDGNLPTENLIGQSGIRALQAIGRFFDENCEAIESHAFSPEWILRLMHKSV
jgi:hypothetical protein